MNNHTWEASIKVDGREILKISAPLVIVVEAMSRTLASIDPLLDARSIVEVKILPYL